jgi:hypothetical protein
MAVYMGAALRSCTPPMPLKHSRNIRKRRERRDLRLLASRMIFKGRFIPLLIN